MKFRHSYIPIVLSLIASSPATSALADACPTATTKLQFLSSGPPTRSTNFTPMPKFAQANIECLKYCRATWQCPQGPPTSTCNVHLSECIQACG